MVKLNIYNTLSGKKEEFVPVNKDHIRMYTCGPTVYNYAHIGNARPAVVSDVLVRVLRVLYPKVTYVSNITDIDDKIINASNDTGKSIKEITKKFEGIYNDDMASLYIASNFLVISLMGWPVSFAALIILSSISVMLDT